MGWSRRIARLISVLAAGFALSVALGSAAHAQSVIRDAEIEKVLRDFTDPILIAADLDPKDVEIVLIQDPSINAFVTSSRSMFIHTGLILAAETPNELKGVLAHETGHMAGGHAARSGEAMDRASRPAYLAIGLGLLAIAAGAPDAGAALIAGAPQFAYGNFVRHTQAQESQADQAAVTLLERTGQSGNGLLSFADRQFRYNELRSANRVPAWMRTHPLWSDRIQALRQRVGQAEHRAQPDSEADKRNLVLIQAKLYGYLEHWSRTLVKYPETDQSEPARYARAIAAMRSSDTNRAMKEAASLVKEFPSNPYYQELAGEILLGAGRIEESLPYYRASLDLQPRQPLFLTNLGRALVATEDSARMEEAIGLLQTATALDPDNASAWFFMSQAYAHRGDEGMARLATAELRFAVGDYGGAVSFAQRAREVLPENTPAWRRAADISVISRAQASGRRS